MFQLRFLTFVALADYKGIIWSQYWVMLPGPILTKDVYYCCTISANRSSRDLHNEYEAWLPPTYSRSAGRRTLTSREKFECSSHLRYQSHSFNGVGSHAGWSGNHCTTYLCQQLSRTMLEQIGSDRR